MNKKTIEIIGGAKTGYNLYKYANSIGIKSNLYHFPNEYSDKKEVGFDFQKCWRGINNIKKVESLVIITSETAYNRISQEDKCFLKPHFFLRNKLNLPKISKQIKSSYIKE